MQKTIQTVKVVGFRPRWRGENLDLYLAYGMNTNRDFMSFMDLTEEPGEPEGVLVDGVQLEFRGHADVVQKEGAITAMVVWPLNREAERKLDGREGVSAGYYKKMVAVFSDGRKALIYQMVRQGPLSPPFTDYLGIISEGLQSFGLPNDHVAEANKRAKLYKAVAAA